MKGLNKWLQQLGIAVKDDSHSIPKAAQPAHSELYQDFLNELEHNNADMQFRAAARLVAHHNYTEALQAYATLRKRYLERRAYCEVKAGMVYLFMQEYQAAFDSFFAAKVHGAEDAESERHIWDACTGLISKNVRTQQKEACINLYLQLFPKGNHAAEARTLLQVSA